MKFKIGQRVYPLVYKTTETITCPSCEGKGYTGMWTDYGYGLDVTYYKNCEDCGGNPQYNDCRGSGKIVKEIKPKWVIADPFVINQISWNSRGVLLINTPKVEFAGIVLKKPIEAKEEDCFATKGERREEMNKRNKKKRG